MRKGRRAAGDDSPPAIAFVSVSNVMAFFKAGLNLPLERINSVEMANGKWQVGDGGVWVCWHRVALSLSLLGGGVVFKARGRNLFSPPKIFSPAKI